MGVILVSWLVLAEPINGAQWVGIGLIAVGLLITGWNYTAV
jgi:drug/metabolite transporter (DMT)-like permease